MTPSISVILPVYNGEAWLGPCIRSVLCQTLPRFELLIGDDVSVDRSRAIITSFDDDPRIRIFISDTNIGLFGTVNRLLQSAQAPVVRFLCQDDILEPHCLAEEVTYLERHPDVMMSICSARGIDHENNVTGEWESVPFVVGPRQCLQMLFYYGCIAGNLSTVSARRGAIERAGGFNESFHLAGDYEMWVRLCQIGNVANRTEKLVRLRDHVGRLSRSAGAGVKFIDETRRIRSQILQLLPEIQSQALRYSYWRQNVLDTNYFIRCLMTGEFYNSAALIRIMGLRDITAGLVVWGLTLNNYLYRPRPVFCQ